MLVAKQLVKNSVFSLFADLLLQVGYQGQEHQLPLRLFGAVLMLY